VIIRGLNPAPRCSSIRTDRAHLIDQSRPFADQAVSRSMKRLHAERLTFGMTSDFQQGIVVVRAVPFWPPQSKSSSLQAAITSMTLAQR
jgi:hypothetical protein